MASIAACSPIAVRTTTSAVKIVRSGFIALASLGLLTGFFLLGMEESLDLLANLPFRNLDIILGLAVIGHQGEESIIRDIKLLII